MLRCRKTAPLLKVKSDAPRRMSAAGRAQPFFGAGWGRVNSRVCSLEPSAS
jgi:hypothetical protein